MVEKWRKQKGYRTPHITIKAPREIILNEGLEPQPFWDNWCDPRDGDRGSDDRTAIRDSNMVHAEYFEVDKWNKKNKTMLARRQAKKLGRSSLVA
jgi:hypothetical protein